MIFSIEFAKFEVVFLVLFCITGRECRLVPWAIKLLMVGCGGFQSRLLFPKLLSGWKVSLLGD